MQKKSKNSDGIDESRCQKRALNMSGFAVELAPMQPSKDAAGSQNLPPSSQSTVYLPPPDLITTFAQSPSHRRVESDSRLNARNPNDVALVRRTSSDPLPAGAQRRLQPWTASPAHAEPAGQPQKLKTLVHRLAHIRYLPPKNSIASLTGIRQHIAHFLHLYRTGLKNEPPDHFSETQLLNQSFFPTELAIIAIIFLDVVAVCCEIMLESVCPHQKLLSEWAGDLNATFVK